MRLAKLVVSLFFVALLTAFLVASCGGPVCGDGVCEGDLDRENCPEDCVYCGNGYCDGDDDRFTCEDDCACENGTCDPGWTVNDCPWDCDPCTTLALNVGELCDHNLDCGQGGYCGSVGSDENAICHQTCIPGGCPDGNMCPDGQVCLRYRSYSFPDGRTFGYCGESVEEGFYESCERTEDCEEGLHCMGIAGTEDTYGAFCAPFCGDGDPCPQGENGMSGVCALIEEGEDPEWCALAHCGDENPCPDGMDCVPVGETGACLWPQ